MITKKLALGGNVTGKSKGPKLFGKAAAEAAKKKERAQELWGKVKDTYTNEGRGRTNPVSIKSVGPGAVKVNINADNNFWKEHLGVDLDPNDHRREVTYVALDPNVYDSGSVVGGHEIINPTKATGDELLKFSEKKGDVVLTTGAYFNMAQAYDKYPEHAPIGETVTPQLEKLDTTEKFIPPPSVAQDTYYTVKFNDGTSLSVSPVLTDEKGKPVVTELVEEKHSYSYVEKHPDPQTGSTISSSGGVFHWQDNNPRALLQLAGNKKADKTLKADKTKVTKIRYPQEDKIRTAMGTSNSRKPGNSGFSMTDWSKIAAMFSRMNPGEKRVYNMDGGYSGNIVCVDKDGQKVFEVSQHKDGREIATMVAFQRKTTDKSAE